MYDAECSICRKNSGEDEIEGGIIHDDDMWLVRHAPSPYPLVGWMILQTKRHIHGPAQLNDRESASFGPALRQYERILMEVTGASAIYSMLLAESVPHFHVHMVPRYEKMPYDSVGWAIGDLFRDVASGRLDGADPHLVTRIIDAYRESLSNYSPV